MPELPQFPTFPLPATVYHYCGQAAALAILESESIWLNSHRGMNDPQDTTWTAGHIQMHGNRRLDVKNLNTPEAERIREFWRAYSINRPDVYVACFSAFDDTLSQWRAYADDGAGFALGFDPLAFGLTKVQAPRTSIIAEHTVGMINVIYDDSKIDALFGPIFDQLVAGGISPDDAAMWIRTLSMFFKNPAYREESEWRIIYSPMLSKTADGTLDVWGKCSEMHFRATKYGVFPYFKLPFTRPAIKEVVLGPKNSTPVEVVQLWLLKHGHPDAKVKRSRASYR